MAEPIWVSVPFNEPRSSAHPTRDYQKAVAGSSTSGTPSLPGTNRTARRTTAAGGWRWLTA
ncbi:MAG: hypothetical protein JNL67_09220 [Planctomycetaceae bacterium]|nr:hypothetical protein [Planctomycetaceae bacterium]